MKITLKAYRVTNLNANIFFSICLYMHRKWWKLMEINSGRAFIGSVTGTEGGEKEKVTFQFPPFLLEFFIVSIYHFYDKNKNRQ